MKRARMDINVMEDIMFYPYATQEDILGELLAFKARDFEQLLIKAAKGQNITAHCFDAATFRGFALERTTDADFEDADVVCDVDMEFSLKIGGDVILNCYTKIRHIEAPPTAYGLLKYETAIDMGDGCYVKIEHEIPKWLRDKIKGLTGTSLEIEQANYKVLRAYTAEELIKRLKSRNSA